MEFSEALKKKTREADAICMAHLPEVQGQQEMVLEAMRYSLEAGGKRIRPILMAESFELFCQNEETRRDMQPVLEAFMAAMEMIHTFSLCHDDLPCMDDDRYRRGRLSTWAMYGEDMGTLAGDGLVLHAFSCASDAALSADWSACSDAVRLERSRAVTQALHILAERSGVYGMLGGQVVDVAMTGGALTEEQLMFIYRLKTGALLEGSMMIGAVLAGADRENLETVRKIGEHVGIAFQIQDDILDETSTQEVLGKPIHSDAENEKTTYVSLHGLEEAAKKVQTLSEEAISAVEQLPVENDRTFLTELIRYLIHREK